ncbi:MAG: hypothetical protein ACKVQK_25595 [Burkholderiales bacterium]
MLFGDTHDDVTAAEIVEVVCEGADRVQHGERIPTRLEFQAFPFHGFAVEQRLDVNRQCHRQMTFFPSHKFSRSASTSTCTLLLLVSRNNVNTPTFRWAVSKCVTIGLFGIVTVNH